MTQEDPKDGASRRMTEEQLRAAAEEIRRLPVTGPLLTDEDLYDEEGLPR